MNLLVAISPRSPADRASIKAIAQPCPNAQGQAVVTYEAAKRCVVAVTRRLNGE